MPHQAVLPTEFFTPPSFFGDNVTGDAPPRKRTRGFECHTIKGATIMPELVKFSWYEWCKPAVWESGQ